MVRKLYFFILFFMLSYIAAWAQYQPQVQELVNALQEYEYGKAGELLEIHKDSISSELKLEAYIKLNRYNDGIALLELMIQEDSLNKKSYIKLADLYTLQGNNREAVNNYMKAIDEEAPNVYLLSKVASLQYQDNKVEQAIQTLDWAMSVDTIQRNLRLQARCYLKLDSISKSVELYEEAIRRDNSDHQAVASLGQLFLDCKLPQDAIYHTSRYMKNDSTNIAVNRVYAQGCFMYNQTKRALLQYNKLVQEGDSAVNTLFYQGLCYLKCDSVSKAYDNLLYVNQKTKECVPNILGYLGIAALEISVNEGIEYIKKAIELSQPNEIQMELLYSNLAKGYGYKKNIPRQIELLKVAHGYVDKPQTLYNIAYLYDITKNYTNAEKYYTLYLKEIEEEEYLSVVNEKMKSDAIKRLEFCKEELFFRQKN